MTERFPIVYVRGYGGTGKGINGSVDDPFYGFNSGSTHVRVGADDKPIFYQFESPLIRLMLDEKYKLLVHGGQMEYLKHQEAGSVDRDSIWVHRFYDEAASTFGQKPEEFSIEKAAADLLELILLLQEKTGAPRVHLVAHSMGGLICRSLIQKVIPDRYAAENKRAVDFVDRLFTYATPHGGIKFDVGFGLLEELRDTFNFGGADIFGPNHMWGFLTPDVDLRARPEPEKHWDPRQLPHPDNFPVERVFCLVGTDAQDYGAALGASSKAVGVKSDGLVQIENAQIPGAPHAYVHRSHSGRYGIVNSEEGYQNLRRFLFGDLGVRADFVHLHPPESKGVVWQGEVQLAVRSLPVLLDDQTSAHYCPVELAADQKSPVEQPVQLITSFLKTDLAPGGQGRYALHVRILSLCEEGGVFGFGDHLEQTADFDDTLIVDLGLTPTGMAAWAVWNSGIRVPLRDYKPSGDPLSLETLKKGLWETPVLLPPAARAMFGNDAAIRLTAFDWREPD